MPDITRRRTGEMLRQLFELLLPLPDGMLAREALAHLEKRLILSPYEEGEYASGGRRFEKIVRFATVDLVKAGWLHKEKGRWTVTSEGKEAYQTLIDPEAFYKEAVRLYHQWKQNQPADVGNVEDDATEDPSAKAASITLEEAEEQAWFEVDQYLRGINPYEFQEIVASLLRAMGYHISWIAPPGKDGGIDILAASDPLGTRPPRIKVQVKRQAQAVNVDGLRSFMALLGDGDVGIFVSVGGFTRDAAEEARTQEKRKVTLINNEELFDLWIEYYDKLSETDRRRLPLQPIYFLALEP
ncbi:MAG TPA: restriction endonuclease [Pyrinomonadaceae bacterium]|jgi:restriction system protein|nr:restriction endonuclease [Pyrinomonadaceae bacterium]